MNEAQAFENERIIEITSPQKPVSNFSLAFSLFLILVVPTIIFFAAGYFYGRSTITPEPAKESKPATITKTEAGTTYTDIIEGYTLTFPTGWEATQKTDDVPGVLVESEDASVEIFLRVKQPYSFDDDQKKAIVKTTKTDITINGEKLKVSENIYDTGGNFSVVELPATEQNPLVTFWFRAADSASNKKAQEIAQSFKFK